MLLGSDRSRHNKHGPDQLLKTLAMWLEHAIDILNSISTDACSQSTSTANFKENVYQNWMSTLKLIVILVWCDIGFQGSHYILVVKFKDFSRTFKDPKVAFYRPTFNEVYSMDRITAIFNIYFFDYGNSFSWQKQNITIINKSCVRQNTWQICK